MSRNMKQNSREEGGPLRGAGRARRPRVGEPLGGEETLLRNLGRAESNRLNVFECRPNIPESGLNRHLSPQRKSLSAVCTGLIDFQR